MTNKILPNTYQAFNIYVDQAMELLTGEEVKCLDFATRHILGWQDKVNMRRANISISRFVDGFTYKDGTRHGGTGLNRAAVIKALNELHRFGLVVKIGEAGTNGQEFELGESPNWALMIERREAKDAANRKRTAKGAEKALSKRRAEKAAKAGTSHAPAAGSTSHEPEAVRPTNQQRSVARTGAGTSDVRNQNHLQNQSQNQVQNAPGGAVVFDRNRVFDCVAWAAFSIKDMTELRTVPGKKDNPAGARIGKIRAWLIEYHGEMPEPLVAARVIDFKQKWASRRSYDMPRDNSKFATEWLAWEQEGLPAPGTQQSSKVQIGRKIEGGNDAKNI